MDLVLLSFAFTAGVFTFFSPCSWALIPAYVGYYTSTQAEAEGEGEPVRALLSGVRFGAAAAAGVFGLFLLGGGLIWIARTRWGLSSAALSGTATGLGLGVAALLIALGALMLWPSSPSLTLPLKAPERRTIPGMVGFGVVFAAGSMGCTFPLFLAVIARALTEGALGGSLALLAFGAGISVLMFTVAVLLSVVKDAVQATVRRIVPYIKPAGGVLLVAAGLYTAWYYLTLP